MNLKYKNKQLLFIAALVTIISCGNKAPDKNETIIPDKKLFEPNKDSILNVKANTLAPWKGNALIRTAAIIKNMQLVFECDLSGIKKELYSFSTDSFECAALNFQFSFNDKFLNKELLNLKLSNSASHTYTNMDDSTAVFSEIKSIKDVDAAKIMVPVYIMRSLPAGKNIEIKVHVWQDDFVSEKRRAEVKQGKITMTAYIRDTLKTKLIDNTYSFSFKMPEVYKTEIICDSIILQNNKDWSPAGSDRTFFKSSYPDLFYCAQDHTGFVQSTSHIERSTDKFTGKDTIILYRYKLHEPFFLNVSDHDNFSRNDVISDTLIDPETLAENAIIKLKFKHVNGFYYKQKNYGKIN